MTLLALLQDTTLHAVHALYEGPTIPNDEELVQMTHLKSQFYDGRVEGIYVYVERNGRVVQRGKVVRADFICGNDHWDRGPLQRNATREDVVL